MEHSALHALQLCGLLLALGGVFFALAILLPACSRFAPAPEAGELGAALSANSARWALRGAAVSAAASFLDLFVQVSELRGLTVFAGIDLPLLLQFVEGTTVGGIVVGKILVLTFMALVLRRPTRRGWGLAGLLGLGAALLTGLVSHAAAQPSGRAAILSAQIAHLLAGAVWIGSLAHFLVSRKRIEACADPISGQILAEMIRRFSPVALISAGLIAASGLYGLRRYVASPQAFASSAYGLTMTVKLALLVPLLRAAFVNYRIVRPALLGEGGGKGADITVLLRRFGRVLEMEVTAGLLVVTVAGIVASLSPPGPDGGQRLDGPQIRALFSPSLPSARPPDPESFFGAATRTVEDLRYAEFTHHWSGAVVLLLGVFWFLQSLGGRVGAGAARCWPFLLAPFAVFVAVASDPEVWLLRKVSFAQAVTDPQILEHQIGALMVLLLIWLGWRDQARPPSQRPLGFALPALMIFGSLLLLGHAHSNLSGTEELTNLINVQHAIFGAFGLFAGTVRWFQLRALVSARIARLLWPALVVGLGAFMTFFYREVV